MKTDTVLLFVLVLLGCAAVKFLYDCSNPDHLAANIGKAVANASGEEE